jgi:hypothetical protein
MKRWLLRQDAGNVFFVASAAALLVALALTFF